MKTLFERMVELQSELEDPAAVFAAALDETTEIGWLDESQLALLDSPKRTPLPFQEFVYFNALSKDEQDIALMVADRHIQLHFGEPNNLLATSLPEDVPEGPFTLIRAIRAGSTSIFRLECNCSDPFVEIFRVAPGDVSLVDRTYGDRGREERFGLHQILVTSPSRLGVYVSDRVRQHADSAVSLACWNLDHGTWRTIFDTEVSSDPNRARQLINMGLAGGSSS